MSGGLELYNFFWLNGFWYSTTNWSKVPLYSTIVGVIHLSFIFSPILTKFSKTSNWSREVPGPALDIKSLVYILARCPSKKAYTTATFALNIPPGLHST